MRRDIDLVRSLLFKIEALDLPPGVNVTLEGYEPEIAVDGYDAGAVGLHLQMLLDGLLVNGRSSGRGVQLTGLSWAGHDFLDSVRSADVWHRTKDGAKRAGGFTFRVLADLATRIIKSEISKHTGLSLT